MLSKETAITGVALLPLCFYFFKQKNIVESVKSAIPFMLVALLFYFQKYEVLGTTTQKAYYELNNYPYTHEKFTSSMVIFVHCLGILVFPHPLMYDYSYNQIPAGSWSSPFTLIGFLLFGFFIYLAFNGFLQRKVWAFALAVFFITLSPALAFVWLRGGIMAERFLYAPSLGFSIAVVYLLAAFWGYIDRRNHPEKGIKENWNNGKRQTSLKVIHHSGIPTFQSIDKRLIAIVAVIFMAYSFKTVDRNKAWKDNMTLFSTDIANAPNSTQNNRQYGHELLERAIAEKDSAKRMEGFHKSLLYLHKAVAINHRFGEAWGDMGRAYFDIKFTPDSAICFFRTAIDVTPNAAVNYSNLGLVYSSLRKYKLASFYFNMALAINPSFQDAGKNVEELKKAGIDVREYPGGENPAFANLQLPVLTIPASNPQ